MESFSTYSDERQPFAHLTRISPFIHQVETASGEILRKKVSNLPELTSDKNELQMQKASSDEIHLDVF